MMILHSSSVSPIYGPRSVSNGSSSLEHTSQVSADITDIGWGTSVADVIKLVKKPALLTVAVKQLPNLNPGPTPTPTPTTTSAISAARFDGRNSESRSTHVPPSLNSAAVSGVYSSASDPVLLPSLNTRNSGAAGAIKRETGNLRGTADIIGSSAGLNAGQDVRNSSQTGPETRSRAVQGVEKNQNPEPPRTSSLLNHDMNSAANIKQDGWPTQQVSGPSKGRFKSF